MQYRTVKYHGGTWGALVEQGWVTMYIIGRMAYMIYCPTRRRD